eukprot:1446461-Alexandrium_andersonii.AAC.1
MTCAPGPGLSASPTRGPSHSCDSRQMRTATSLRMNWSPAGPHPRDATVLTTGRPGLNAVFIEDVSFSSRNPSRARV